MTAEGTTAGARTDGSGGAHGAPPDHEWLWGVVVRVDDADGLLRRVARVRRGEDVVPQRPGTGHVTLFYASVTAPDGVAALARSVAPAVAGTAPFRLRLGGFAEFVTAGRVVAWLRVEDDLERLRQLRHALCDCAPDTLTHPFVPHLTLVHGDSPEAYATVRPIVQATAAGARIDVRVEELWIAGFPRGGHPADELVYRARLPLSADRSDGVPALAPVGVAPG